MGATYVNKEDKAKAIGMKRLGPQHPHTKDAQTWSDFLKQPPRSPIPNFLE